jgi:microcystin-dependent protein
MSEPYLADIKIFGFNFPPRGYASCDGQILPINQNQSLYSLLGTTYGGDGRTTFALPDLRGRAPIHKGSSNTAGSSNHTLGELTGAENVALAANQLPAHTHGLSGTDATPASADPSGARLAPAGGGRTALLPYGPATNLTPLSGAIAATGGAGHSNMQPYQVLNFCIALQGLFPSRN